jgi:hypothetical protein
MKNQPKPTKETSLSGQPGTVQTISTGVSKLWGSLWMGVTGRSDTTIIPTKNSETQHKTYGTASTARKV